MTLSGTYAVLAQKSVLVLKGAHVHQSQSHNELCFYARTDLDQVTILCLPVIALGIRLRNPQTHSVSAVGQRANLGRQETPPKPHAMLKRMSRSTIRKSWKESHMGKVADAACR